MESIDLNVNSEMGKRVAAISGLDVIAVVHECLSHLDEKEQEQVYRASTNMLKKLNDLILEAANKFPEENFLAMGIAMNSMVLLDIMLNWVAMFDKIALDIEIDELEGQP